MDSTFLLREIWTLLLDIQESKQFLIAPIAKKYNLTPLQLRVLIEIEHRDQLSLNQLAKSLDMNNGNTSTLCKKLEREGWLIRKRRQDDERYIALDPCEKTKTMLLDLEVHLKEQYDPVLHQVDEDAVRRIRTGLLELRRLTNLLNEQQTARKDEEKNAKK